MLYEFECNGCETRAEKPFRMGEAPRTVKCGKCGGRASRVFSAFALAIDGGINRKSTFGESMRNGNAKAAKRMKGRKAPVETVAYDYGGGDVREAK